jgi:hypothetical protein
VISSPRSSRFLIARTILVWRPQIVRPSLADMLRPSMQTLKHIAVIIINLNVDVGDGLLFGIPSDFEDMSTKNIIETVTIEIIFENWHPHQGDNWGRLDEVLTTPGWFSLKRVSLAIEIRFGRRNSELEVALRKLPETQFPRLSSSNSVSFDFKARVNGYQML